MKTILITLLFGVAVILTSPSLAALQQEVGTCTYVEGRVDVLHSGAENAVPILREEKVFVGDIIRTKSFSKAEIAFKDKTVLRLGSNTRVLIEEYVIGNRDKRERASLKLFRGKIRALVSKARGSDNFFINTPNTCGSVKGSDIFAFYQAAKTGILVKEGSISAYNNLFPDKPVSVTKGEALFIPLEQPPQTPRPYLEVEMKLHEKDTNPSEIRPTPQKELLTTMEGWVVKTGGSVNVRKYGQTEWRHAKMNETLNEGDEVKTEPDGNIELRLENGNSIAVKPNSEVKLAKLRRDPKTGEYENFLEAKFGKFKVTVERLSGKSKFEVKTPTAVCGIRGTIMYLDVLPDLTTAFYEGGGGEVTNLISGMKKMVDAGQNSSSGIDGNVTDPQNTTDEERMEMDESWGSDEGVDGYSSPEDNVGDTPASHEIAGGDEAGAGGAETTGETGTQEPFSDVPFEGTGGASTSPEEEEELEEATVLEGELKGNFGQFDEDGNFEYDNEDGDPQLFAILRSFSASPETWEGPPSAITLGGVYSNSFNSRLWFADIEGSAIDGTNFKGRMAGFMNSWEGVFSVIYVNPPQEDGISEAGLAFGHCLDGIVIPIGNGDDGGLFFGNSEMALEMTMNENVGITPGELFDVFSNSESKTLDLESYDNASVYLNGSVYLDMYRIENEIREDWGIWESKWYLGYEKWYLEYENEDNEEFQNWALMVNGNNLNDYFLFTISGKDAPGPDSGALRLDMMGLSLTDFDEGEGYRTCTFYVGTAFGAYDAYDGEDIFQGGGAGIFIEDDNIDEFPQGLYNEPEDEALLIGDGTGFFIDGGTRTGNIDVDSLYGGKLKLEEYGLWYFSAQGTADGPTASNWKVVLGGCGYEGFYLDSNPEESEPEFVWLGTIEGDTEGEDSDLGRFTGKFKGFWFSEDSAGTMETWSEEDVVGNYIEGESYTWQAIGIGEWVEVTDLLDQSVFESIDMQQFVSVPITAVHSDIISGTGTFNNGVGELAASIDISVYENDYGNIWTALIDGTYTGEPSEVNTWNLNFTDGLVNVALTGDEWDKGEWHADVNGTHNDINFQGEAAGTYGDNKFEGIGAGTWQEGD